jgi:hypothetical protein
MPKGETPKGARQSQPREQLRINMLTPTPKGESPNGARQSQPREQINMPPRTPTPTPTPMALMLPRKPQSKPFRSKRPLQFIPQIGQNAQNAQNAIQRNQNAEFSYVNPLVPFVQSEPSKATPQKICKNQARSSKAQELSDRLKKEFFMLLANNGITETSMAKLNDYFMYCSQQNVVKEQDLIKRALMIPADVDLQKLKKSFDAYYLL